MKTRLLHRLPLIFAIVLKAWTSVQAQTPPVNELPVGTVVAWGASLQATLPPGLSNVVAISGGHDFSMVLKADRTVVAWGSNGYGQTDVPAGLSNIVAIDAGNFHSMVLGDDRAVLAWGYNFHGQCNVPVGLSNVLSIAAGGTHSMVLKSNGTVVVWGDTGFGLQDGAVGLTNILAIAAGSQHCLALKSDNTVIAWGINNCGQSVVPSGLTDVVAIAAGACHSLAVKRDGTVVTWGWNNLPGSLSNVVAVGGGYAHSLALKSDGQVVAWGQNESQQSSVPPGLSNVVAIAAGGFHGLALVSASGSLVHCTPHKAKATVQWVNGFVVGAIITDSGCGYTNVPLVLIQDGGGSGAAATAVLTDGRVTAINITSAGIGYETPPRIVIVKNGQVAELRAIQGLLSPFSTLRGLQKDTDVEGLLALAGMLDRISKGLNKNLATLPKRIGTFIPRLAAVIAASPNEYAEEVLQCLRGVGDRFLDTATVRRYEDWAGEVSEVRSALGLVGEVTFVAQDLVPRDLPEVLAEDGLDTEMDLRTMAGERHPGDHVVVEAKVYFKPDENTEELITSGEQRFRVEAYGLYTQSRSALIFVGCSGEDAAQAPSPSAI